MTRKILLLFILLFSLLSVPAFATLQSVSENTIMMYNLTVWGMNLGVGYKGFSLLEDRDTILWLFAGARVTDLYYFRDANDDNLDVEMSDYDDLLFWSAHVNWGAGFPKGL